MSIQEVRVVDLSEVDPEVWDGVAGETGGSPMVLRDWIDCAIAAYGAPAQAKAVVVGDLAAPRAVMPLMREKGLAGRYFFAGNEGGVVPVACRDSAAVAGLAQGLLQFGRPINLGHRPAASPLIGEIRRSGAGRVVVASRPLDRHLAPFLDLDPSWSAPERYLSKSRMQSIRRRQRQLEAMGELTVAFLTPDETAVDAVLETAFKVEAKGWKQAEGIALEADPAQAAFYRSYARAIAAKGRLHVTLLSVDGNPLAMSIGEIYRGTYWAYKTGFDSAFRKYAPGILLQYRLVQHLAEQGLTRLDFQGQLDDFKRIWTERAVEAAAFRIYPLTPRGLFALGVDLATHGRNALTSWVQQVGARVRGRSPGPGAKPSAAS